ncbi:flavonoid 3-O-glucosyltransferase-like [Prunus avium]|uniref:Glycosyltransferase n=1 Tax=Prunus avium TaxID=42229 RepID=A0A6P5S556_PRUAV|nr:flavonoid 3-O-glucosyltransferase-like [Prunus avium]
MPIMNHKACTQHVAVIVFPFASHPGTLLRFIRIISAMAPKVKFSFLSLAKSNSSLFTESNSKGFENIKPFNVWDGVPGGYAFSGNPLEPIDLFLNVAPGSFKKGIEEAEAEIGQKVGCLISDAFLWFAGEMAEEMQVPWVPLWTSGQRSLLAHVGTDVIREKVGASGDKDQTLDFLPGFSAFHASDLPEGVAFENSESPIAVMVHKMGQKLPQATAVAINSFQDIDLEVVFELKKRFHKFLHVGPFSLIPTAPIHDEHGCLEWLDKHKRASVAYVSFGIIAKLPPHELAALAEALEEGRFPFIWSFRGNEKDFPEGFVERTDRNGLGKVVPWVSQAKVLNHSSVGVFVTHCGWNSVLESITGGVPMICRPFLADQPLNMRTLEVLWRIGVGIEGGVLTKSGAMKALELFLSSKQGNEMRERTSILKVFAEEAVKSYGRTTEDLNVLVNEIICGPSKRKWLDWVTNWNWW